MQILVQFVDELRIFFVQALGDLCLLSFRNYDSFGCPLSVGPHEHVQMFHEFIGMFPGESHLGGLNECGFLANDCGSVTANITPAFRGRHHAGRRLSSRPVTQILKVTICSLRSHQSLFPSVQPIGQGLSLRDVCLSRHVSEIKRFGE
jgi:hypothetical protein